MTKKKYTYEALAPNPDGSMRVVAVVQADDDLNGRRLLDNQLIFNPKWRHAWVTYGRKINRTKNRRTSQ
jgi:hypothetical protein